MEYQKIINLLDNETIQPFRTIQNKTLGWNKWSVA